MNDIEQLRQLLIGPDRARLEALEEAMASPSRHAQRTADTLAQSISAVNRQAEFVASLSPSVEQCIKDSVRRDAAMYAEALFPVIGPAIRRAIAEALKSMVQTINHAVEYSLTAKGLALRWQALRAGVPFPEYLLNKTLEYRVEQIFLIQPQTGLLMAHLAHPQTRVTDADAVSAMLTAIRQFVGDSFAANADDQLDAVDVGEHGLWLQSSPHAFMALAVRGQPPRSLRVQMQEVLEQISANHGDVLSAFDGDRQSMFPVTAALEPLLSEKRHAGEADGQAAGQGGGRLRRGLTLAVLGIATLGLLGSGGHAWLEQRHYQHQIDSVVHALDNTPGIRIDRVVDGDRRTVLHGLRDPAAPSPQQVLDELQIATPVGLEYRLAPYLSLEPALMLQRLAAVLAPPPDARLALQGDTLVVTGIAPRRWLLELARADVLRLFHLRLDIAGARQDTESLLRELQVRLQPPGTVTLAIDGDAVRLNGRAPVTWLQGLPADIPELALRVDQQGMRSQEQQRLVELVSALEATTFSFTRRAALATDQSKILRVADQLRQAEQLARQLRQPLQCTLTGHSDGTGGRDANRQVRAARAASIDLALERAGVTPSLCRTQTSDDFPSGDTAEPQLRRVTVSIRGTLS